MRLKYLAGEILPSRSVERNGRFPTYEFRNSIPSL